MLSDDPQRNSLVQRVWLYNDDPALKYRCSVRALRYCACGVLTCCHVVWCQVEWRAEIPDPRRRATVHDRGGAEGDQVQGVDAPSHQGGVLIRPA
jgi:hypothetical protein